MCFFLKIHTDEDVDRFENKRGFWGKSHRVKKGWKAWNKKNGSKIGWMWNPGFWLLRVSF